MNETWKARRQMAPYEGEEDYIFISYSHQDMDLVLPVLRYLPENGVRFWYDEGIDPGSEWPEAIARHLNGCRGCVAFMSPNSLASSNCRREVNFSLSKNKEFLSVILTPVEMSLGMEMQISSYQSLMKYRYADDAEFLDKLLSVELIASCRSVKGGGQQAAPPADTPKAPGPDRYAGQYTGQPAGPGQYTGQPAGPGQYINQPINPGQNQSGGGKNRLPLFIGIGAGAVAVLVAECRVT